jgi:hypothetical protein
MRLGLYHLVYLSILRSSHIPTVSGHSDATAIAQVQLPNLTQQELPLHRTPAGEHLFGFWPIQTAGEYKTVIQTDIKDKMVNTRFSFSKDRQNLIAKSENE